MGSQLTIAAVVINVLVAVVINVIMSSCCCVCVFVSNVDLFPRVTVDV